MRHEITGTNGTTTAKFEMEVITKQNDVVWHKFEAKNFKDACRLALLHARINDLDLICVKQVEAAW